VRGVDAPKIRVKENPQKPQKLAKLASFELKIRQSGKM
jgi:hypothetical protein